MSVFDQIDELSSVVSSEILVRAVEASQTLTRLGVPHALIGGLAVGMHGHARATKDADYLVGPEAFVRMSPVIQFREEIGGMVRMGVLDFMPVPERYDRLIQFLRIPAQGELPVVPIEGLILLKLDANRPQDRADVVALLRCGIDKSSISEYLGQNAPELLERFAELVLAAR